MPAKALYTLFSRRGVRLSRGGHSRNQTFIHNIKHLFVFYDNPLILNSLLTTSHNLSLVDTFTISLFPHRFQPYLTLHTSLNPLPEFI